MLFGSVLCVCHSITDLGIVLFSKFLLILFRVRLIQAQVFRYFFILYHHSFDSIFSAIGLTLCYSQETTFIFFWLEKRFFICSFCYILLKTIPVSGPEAKTQKMNNNYNNNNKQSYPIFLEPPCLGLERSIFYFRDTCRCAATATVTTGTATDWLMATMKENRKKMRGKNVIKCLPLFSLNFRDLLPL